MNILHYSLGIYPDRQGGLVRYSTDLAIEQARKNNVYYLVPGKLGLIDKRVRIVKGKNYRSVKVFIIENALPIPLFAGIKDIDLYTKRIDKTVYVKFLNNNGIEVIHIHTLMGLHIEFLVAAKELGIPVFMTTHDFFGICPITTLFREGQVCENCCIDNRCFDCSLHAHSYFKLAVGQSRLYKTLKNKALVSKIRENVLGEESFEISDKRRVNPSIFPDYLKLNQYYTECFSMISCFLFNSNQTKEIYESHLGKLTGETHLLMLPSIKDQRRLRTFLSDGILHIGFMGECKEFKGYFLLLEAIEELKEEGYSIELDVYNSNVRENGVVVKKGAYTADHLGDIYDYLDVVVVPSIWYETLSFIAIEALYGGMPCVISNHVGAKELFNNGKNGFIVRAGNKESIKKIMRDLLDNPNKLSEVNQNIVNNININDFKAHCEKLVYNYNHYINDNS